MQFNAKARYIRFSPYKLRPVADVIRGKNVQFALNWLETAALKKAMPLKKLVASAAANAKQLHDVDVTELHIKEIRVDQGPAYKYFKPGAMGRSNIYKKRFSHISVVLEPVETKEVSSGTKS
jgi:large subunit ribosomal protein L22